jgi:hypothetical protein
VPEAGGGSPRVARSRSDRWFCWTFVEHHVVDTGASDHLAVVATFAIPQ